MVPGSTRTGARAGVNSSRLVRLLTELAAVEVAESQPSFAERLGVWLNWTDAIALSSVLQGAAVQPGDAQLGAAFSAAWALAAPGDSMHAVASAQAARVQAELSRAISLDSVLAPAQPVTRQPAARPGSSRQSVPTPPPSSHLSQPQPLPMPSSIPDSAVAAGDIEAEFLPYRRSYAKHQRAMGTRIASLRIDVRAALAQGSPSLGRLAALDAAMDEMLGVHERGLLSTVPRLLQKRFERLHRAQAQALALALEPSSDARSGRMGAWQQGFGRDMQAVLLAELEIRMQPVEGLLEALGHEPGSTSKKPQ